MDLISEGLVSKTARVMETLLEEQKSTSLRKIAEKCDMPKSTLHRILSSLEEEGWVYRNPSKREYRIGIRFMCFAQKWRLNHELALLAHPLMESLSEISGETAVLAVREKKEIRCLEVVETSNPIKYHFRIGTRLPIHAGAMGKIILAYSPLKVREEILSSPLEKFTDNTLTSPEVLRKELELIRERGYSVSIEEVDIGGAAIGAPILGPEGELLAGLILDGLTHRIETRLEDMVPMVTETARKITDLVSS